MSLVVPTILSDGREMNPAVDLLSIDIVKEVNRIPYAQLVLVDGDAAQQKFALSDSGFFEPGKTIEIKLHYAEEPQKRVTVFQGLVVGHGVQASGRGSLLTVELKDAAIRLTQTRKSAVYREQSDSQIIGKLVTDSGLKKGRMAPTPVKHPELVQYYCTDWDFILARADIFGLLVHVQDGAISLSEIALSGAPQQEFEYGISEIYDFEIEADAAHQVADVESIGWNGKQLKLTSATRAANFRLAQGNLNERNIASAVGGGTLQLKSAVPLEPGELKAWANSTLTRTRMAMIRGRIAIAGIGALQLSNIISIKGIGKRFNGKTMVTGIRHQVDQDGWRTDVQFGLPTARFADREAILDAPAAGLLPAVNGLQIGIVGEFKEDPTKELRVPVVLPGLDAQNRPIWTRLAAPDAGNQHGYFFRPEPGDEVVVGFLNDDPRQPVILGAMYGSKNKPPTPVSKLSKENIDKGIVTKKGTTIRFVDDQKAKIFIETPAKNKIVLDDDSETIQLSDQHGNSIKLSKNGIEIKSAKDLKIESSGNVEIKGQKIDVK